MTFAISKGLDRFQNATLPTRAVIGKIKASKGAAPRRGSMKSKPAPAPKSKR